MSTLSLVAGDALSIYAGVLAVDTCLLRTDDLHIAKNHRLLDFRIMRADAQAGYDAIGELTSWAGREANGTLRLNEQLGYGYDAAGNLNLRTNNALVQNFSVNSLNEITSVARSGTLTVSGNTPAPAGSVTVNGQPALTYADFTFVSSNGVALNNGPNSFTNIAKNYYGNVAVTNTVNVSLPQTVALQYDANGNLTNDGIRSFGYDPENQLTNVTVAGQWREDFFYDGLNRRRIARQYSWVSGTWVIASTETRYIYDNNSVVQESDSNNVAQVNYTRGVAGLLARTDSGGSVYYHADGNANITALMDTNQFMVGRYLYDPFGRMLGKWGPKADVNLYRFASKEWDVNAGFAYFGRRFYDPNLQRFINRDPINERGGVNLYAYCQNNPICLLDMMGFCPHWWDDFVASLGMDADQIGYGLIDVPYQISENVVNGALNFGSGTANAAYNGQGGWDWAIGISQDLSSMSQVTSIFGISAAGLVSDTTTLTANATEETPAVFENAPSGFSNGNLAQQAHDNFQQALNDLYGTQNADWRVATAPGQTGVDATYVGPASGNPGFNFAELKPYSANSLGTFGNQLGNWGLPEGQTELFFYNKSGVIGSSGFKF
jgi:RHS repeat-associated protein